MSTSPSSSQTSQICEYESTGHGLPLLQRQGNVAHAAKDSDGTDTRAISVPAPARATCNEPVARGATNALWLHREQIISLFWAQDLPLREVQEIMKREHGLDASTKAYKSNLRRWGIRKNLKGHEALELATGQASSSAFWPDGRDNDYTARIHRHVSRSKRKRDGALQLAQSRTPSGGRQAVNPPRRLRGPDLLEKVESATYYLNVYLSDFAELRTWFWTGPSAGEQEAFSSLFIRGLGRLSRNEQQHQAFREINLAYDHLKRLVELDHPLVYLRIIIAISAFNQYPQSEICSYICRSLSEYIRKLSAIVHGAGHPLNNAWGDAIYFSSIEGPESFALAVPAQVLRRCRSVRARIIKGAFNIADCVPSDARGLDEASLRQSLAGMAPRRDLLPTAQEVRLAMAELMISQGRCAEGLHFFSEAMAFQGEDQARRASKTFWAAELEWRSGNGRASIETLRSALEYADVEAAGETGDEAAGRLRGEIGEVLCRRRSLLFLEETSGRIPSCG